MIKRQGFAGGYLLTGQDGVVVSTAHPDLSVTIYKAELDLAATELRDALTIALTGNAETINVFSLCLIARSADPYASASARLESATRLARAGLDDAAVES